MAALFYLGQKTRSNFSAVYELSLQVADVCRRRYSDPQKVCVHRPLSLPRYNVR